MGSHHRAARGGGRSPAFQAAGTGVLGHMWYCGTGATGGTVGPGDDGTGAKWSGPKWYSSIVVL